MNMADAQFRVKGGGILAPDADLKLFTRQMREVQVQNGWQILIAPVNQFQERSAVVIVAVTGQQVVERCVGLADA